MPAYGRGVRKEEDAADQAIAEPETTSAMTNTDESGTRGKTT